MKIEIIEPKKEFESLTREELNAYQLEAGELVELTYIVNYAKDTPTELTSVFLFADTIGASSYLVDVRTGMVTKTQTRNPLSNCNLYITKVRFFKTSRLILEREENE